MELKEEQDQKRTVLANLRKDIKDYPRGLLQLKARLESELNSRIGSPVRIDILADVLELADERWRGAVEEGPHNPWKISHCGQRIRRNPT